MLWPWSLLKVTKSSIKLNEYYHHAKLHAKFALSCKVWTFSYWPHPRKFNVKVLATQAGQPNNDHYTDLHSLCKSKFNKWTRKMNHLPWHVLGKSPLSVCPHVRGLMGDGEWQCYWHWKPSSLGSVSPFQLPSAETINLTIIIMYIYHVLINALSAHTIHINLNTIFYTHIEHSPTETIYVSVSEWGREWGKQVGSMNEESQVRGCYNITFIYANKEMLQALLWIRQTGAQGTAYTKRRPLLQGHWGKNNMAGPVRKF